MMEAVGVAPDSRTAVAALRIVVGRPAAQGANCLPDVASLSPGSSARPHFKELVRI